MCLREESLVSQQQQDIVSGMRLTTSLTSVDLRNSSVSICTIPKVSFVSEAAETHSYFNGVYFSPHLPLVVQSSCIIDDHLIDSHRLERLLAAHRRMTELFYFLWSNCHKLSKTSPDAHHPSCMTRHYNYPNLFRNVSSETKVMNISNPQNSPNFNIDCF